MSEKSLEETVRDQDGKWEDLWNHVLGKYSEFAWKRSQHIYDATEHGVDATRNAIQDISDEVVPKSITVNVQEAYDVFYDRFTHYKDDAGVSRNTALIQASEDVTAYIFTARNDCNYDL